MCIVCIANNVNRNVYMYLNTRIFPTTGHARVLLFMFTRRELGGTGTGCLFQFTYCVNYQYNPFGVPKKPVVIFLPAEGWVRNFLGGVSQGASIAWTLFVHSQKFLA